MGNKENFKKVSKQLCEVLSSHVENHFTAIREAAKKNDLDELNGTIEDLFLCFYGSVFGAMVIPAGSTLEKEIEPFIQVIKGHLLEQTRAVIHAMENNGTLLN